MNLKIKGVGGYASVTEDGKNIHVRGQYGHSATIPIEDIEKVLSVYNSEKQKKKEGRTDGYSLAQITGSSGPSTDFVLFYNSKQQAATDAKEAEDAALTAAMAAKEAAEQAARKAAAVDICFCAFKDDKVHAIRCQPCRSAERAQRRADKAAQSYLGARKAAFVAVLWLEDPAFCSE